MGQLWEKVTYYRHRSELAALRLALRVPLLAMHLIGAVVFFWWGVAGLSVLIPTLLVSQILGTLGLLLGGISAIVLLLFVTPWFSGGSVRQVQQIGAAMRLVMRRFGARSSCAL
ncbi:hypothetical protein [Rhizobium binae]|uniref:hypothetical protein n=1 Tax=Rhizobium binae TaxID=1138190 RepID=UPI001C82E662|nr:hypothetical protein [Rhizobium binae]MBX4963526.1 hypothetical protein [Rhizobium binae]